MVEVRTEMSSLLNAIPSPSPSSRMVDDDGVVGARTESRFQSSEMHDEAPRGRKAGCCSLGEIGGGATMTVLPEAMETGRLFLAGFRGGTGMTGIGGFAWTVCS
jgi:hypothetical protein